MIPLVILFGGFVVGLIICAMMLQKAGFSPSFAPLFPIFGFLPLIVFAISEWPIHRELGWLRVMNNAGSESDKALANSYALQLERSGEWSRAIDVYEVLAERASDPKDAEYFREAAAHLRERINAA
jgi:hypothetical protein